MRVVCAALEQSCVSYACMQASSSSTFYVCSHFVVRACAGQTFHPKWPSSTLHDLVPPLLSLLISSCPPSHIPPTSFYLCLQPSTSIVLHVDTQLPSLVSSTCPNQLSLLFKSLPYILQIPFHSLMDPSFDVLPKEL